MASHLFILFFVAAKPVHADDFTKFLAGDPVRVIDQSLVEDKYGNRYKLRFADEVSMSSEVGFSMLTESLGLPNAGVYPFLAKRGGEWLPATLQPVGGNVLEGPMNEKRVEQIIATHLTRFVAVGNFGADPLPK